MAEPGVYVIDDLLEECPSELLLLLEPDGGVELRETERGERMLLVYTEHAELVRCCGAGQPWRAVETRELLAGSAEERVSLVAVDLPLPEGHRYPEADVREVEPLLGYPRLPGVGDEVWIASTPFTPAHRDAQAELFRDEDRRFMVLAYSSLEVLRAGCGPYQPAVRIPIARLDDVVAASGAADYVFDVELNQDLRHRAPVLDW